MVLILPNISANSHAENEKNKIVQHFIFPTLQNSSNSFYPFIPIFAQ